MNDNSQIDLFVQNFLATSNGGDNLSEVLTRAFDDFPTYETGESLPGEKGLLGKLVQGFNWYYNPMAYSAEKSAETARINTERTLQYNTWRDSKQFKLQAMNQLLQYVQQEKSLAFQGEQGQLNRNLQDKLAQLQRELQEVEGDRNRKSQESIAFLQRELQRQEGLLNRESQAIEYEKNRFLQAYLAKLQQDLQREEGLLNRELQAELATLQREFQAQEGKLNRDHGIQLEIFREKLQIYLFDCQKQLQLEIQRLSANLARELKRIDLQNSKELVREQRRLNNFPLNMDEQQLLKDHLEGVIPFNLFFVPPTIKYDPMGIADDAKTFPKIEGFLNKSVGNLVGEYNRRGRTVDYYDSAWRSKSFQGRAAYNNLFQGLNANPTGIIDCLIEGDDLTIAYAYWSEQFRLPNCQDGSTLMWREILYTFAKERLLKWFMQREQCRRDTGSTDKFDRKYSQKTIAKFQADLEILNRELQHISEGKDPRKEMDVEEREYHIMPDDMDRFRQILAQEIHLTVGLIIDEYYLLGVAPQYRQRPLLPELFPSLLQGCPKDLLESRVRRMIMAYTQMYQVLEQNESAWIPELRLDLVQSLIRIPDTEWAKQWARAQLGESLRAWLKLRGLPQPEGLGSLVSAVSTELTRKDVPYIDQLNQCLTVLGETYRLSVESSCYNRGIRHYQRRNYQFAIADLSQAITLNPNLMDAYLHRGKAYDELGQHKEANSDFKRALELQGKNITN
jgi:Flp pilus assembly protein TadD, contains TPR repeats